MRPLSTLLHNSLPPRESHYNAGLWYDKFCDQWCMNGEKHGLDRWSLEAFERPIPGGRKESVNPKLNWIGTVSAAGIGLPAALEEAKARLDALVAANAGKLRILETAGPFVSGLGRSHPVENGFVWHHTLGVPYLPGSSVKGMVRAWVEQWWAGAETGPTQHDKDRYRRVFGESNAIGSNPPTGVGSVVFLDALPIKPVQLEADVMTPHYAPYYQDVSGNTPPADWHSPIPIPFLVVAVGACFAFGLLPRNRRDEQHVTDCTAAEGWLCDALAQIGAGAKTAVGYGRFNDTSDARSPPAGKKEHSQVVGKSDSRSSAKQPCPAPPVKDELTLFREWFDREGFVQGRKRGEQNKVMERIAKLPDPKPAIEYVRLRLTKKDKDNAPSVWAWLQQQHSNRDKQS